MRKSRLQESAPWLREAIHDRLGPRLFAAATKLSLLKRELNGSAGRRVAEALAEVEAARQEARRIVAGGPPEASGGLRASLERLAFEHGGEFSDLSEGVVAEGEMAEELLGVAQEAAHNAVKHGGARAVQIRLGRGLLEVEDDGSGLARGWKRGMGILLMKRRARRIGGGLTLQTVAEGRTILACHFALCPKT